MQSNRNKVKYLRDTALECKAPFIVLTETHLKPDILNAEVKIEGYSLYRSDRGENKSHGGVAIYLRDDLTGQLVSVATNSMCETLAIKVKTLNLLLMVVYRPPNSTLDCFDEAMKICQKAIDDVTNTDPKVKDVMLMGDFNLPCISWPSGKIYEKQITSKSKEKQQAEILVNFVEANFMENYIHTATRGKNTLDLVFTNNHKLVNNYTTTVNNKLSDHHLLTVALNFSYNKEIKDAKVTNPYTTKVYEYKLAEATESDWKRFDRVLEVFSSTFEEETKDFGVERKLESLYKHVERATKIVFERKEAFEEKDEGYDSGENEPENITKKAPNKIPKKIRKLMRKKSKLSSKILSSTSWQKNYVTMIELRKIEEELDESYKAQRIKQEKDAIKNIKRNPRYFYKYAKKFSKNNGEIATFVKENGELTDDPGEKSEILRKQYESVASTPMEEFKVPDNFFTENDFEQTNEEQPGNNHSPEMVPCTDVCSTQPFISECIEMLSARAAPGPDGIPSEMLKGANTTFAFMLSNILRSSLDTGEIPSILKMAYVTPVHKGESRSEPANFRPVSLTSHIIKTLERVIRKTLVSHLERNGLMDVNQHGSRANRSTLSQLLQHHDDVLKDLEEGNNVDSVYTDFSKAFDKCDHGILMHKLKRMKIKGKLGRWIQSFLKMRQQIILVDKVKSSSSMIVSGIPQGSVLAPILFLIYISDIGEDLIASTLVYVDDAKVKQSVKSESDVEHLQYELNKLDQWAIANNMEFNKKKFQVLRYGEDEDLKNETSYFTGNYDEVIERFESLRDLGVELSDDGAFDAHIEKVCKKARQKSGWIFRTFYSRNSTFLRQMFKSLVQPHLDYCSQLWAPLEGKNLEKIEKVLKDFTKRIPELQSMNYWQRLKKMKMSSEQRRLERYKIIYIWKIMNELVPNPGVEWTAAGERRGRVCLIPKLKGTNKVQKLRQQSFQMSGPQLWNSLPKSVRNLKTNNLDDFKQILDEYLCKVPDEPKCVGLNPGATNVLSGRPSNSIIYQVARRTEEWRDTDQELDPATSLFSNLL